MASKSRKRIFPKPPQRLNSKTALTLGKNSNKVCKTASILGIYLTETPIKQSTPLSLAQEKQLERLKVNLQAKRQK